MADAAEMVIALVAAARMVTIVAIAVRIALKGAVNVLPVGLALVVLGFLLALCLVVVHTVVVWLRWVVRLHDVVHVLHVVDGLWLVVVVLLGHVAHVLHVVDGLRLIVVVLAGNMANVLNMLHRLIVVVVLAGHVTDILNVMDGLRVIEVGSLVVRKVDMMLDRLVIVEVSCVHWRRWHVHSSLMDSVDRFNILLVELFGVVGLEAFNLCEVTFNSHSVAIWAHVRVWRYDLLHVRAIVVRGVEALVGNGVVDRVLEVPVSIVVPRCGVVVVAIAHGAMIIEEVASALVESLSVDVSLIRIERPPSIFALLAIFSSFFGSVVSSRSFLS